MVAMSFASCSISSFGARGDFGNGVEIVILEMDLVQVPRRGHFHFAAVGQLDLALEIELRVDAGLGQRLADHVAGEGLG